MLCYIHNGLQIRTWIFHDVYKDFQQINRSFPTHSMEILASVEPYNKYKNSQLIISYNTTIEIFCILLPMTVIFRRLIEYYFVNISFSATHKIYALNSMQRSWGYLSTLWKLFLNVKCHAVLLHRHLLVATETEIEGQLKNNCQDTEVRIVNQWQVMTPTPSHPQTSITLFLSVAHNGSGDIYITNLYFYWNISYC